ncbi:SF1B family DNA helicase RecD2 [Aureispira anguillae]|uniref:ATP-dependent RecD-like DNA helicase n=1 Tax=Aureispira anguillae TaxID=2864201 RepID=A0A916DS19_9BACT|nr:ATP-dependent RecD-like DNA helicase [Aureispira anguillae]BDS10767.1 ATP-dependent RecD-like DNA helicase [Aureispira anguillae]
MEKIEGSLEHIIYRNEENGYTVGKLLEKETARVITIVGSMMGIQIGETLVCEGNWRNDKRFGKQFVVTLFNVNIPSTTRGIEQYLSSGSVAGIGEVFAKRIVDHFGENTLEIFDIAPHRLLEVEGIGKKKLERIQSSWIKQKDIRQVMIFLQNYGISPAYAQRIFKVYGQESIEKVKDNPYRLSTEIDGIGFKKSDAIAQKMGIEIDADSRIASGIEYSLEQMAKMGHSCYPLEELVKEAAMLLGVAYESVNKAIHALAEKGRILLQLLNNASGIPQTFVWSKIHYDYEKDIAAEIFRLQLFDDVFVHSDWEEAIEQSSKKYGITLAVEQEKAVEKSLEEKIHIITGGPGTGKSTITKVVLDICLASTSSILLAAPTGRAAKRLSEITKREASTIHSLLTFDFVSHYFRKNKYDQLDCEVIIIDEASMIDAFLMSALLKAIPSNCKVILVGDVDQLPSVGAGNVLNDLILSKRVPVTRLKEIFRQAINSQIVLNAHRINQGIFPTITTDKSSDFFFITERQPERIIQHVLGLIDRRLPKAYQFHKLRDIQLLCPMNKGKIGSIEFNRVLQLSLNPKKKNEETGVGPRKLVEGDKVIQIRNNYDKGVSNGDIGYIKKISEVDKLLIVEFEGKDIEYEFSELLELDLAYAVSVHKYQGSESPCIIMPIHESYNRLLFRNLLYTGITRGKQLVILVGTKEAVSAAIRNNKAHKRYTGLVAKLEQEGKGLPVIQIVPMLGTENYSKWVEDNFGTSAEKLL